MPDIMTAGSGPGTIDAMRNPAFGGLAMQRFVATGHIKWLSRHLQENKANIRNRMRRAGLALERGDFTAAAVHVVQAWHLFEAMRDTSRRMAYWRKIVRSLDLELGSAAVAIEEGMIAAGDASSPSLPRLMHNEDTAAHYRRKIGGGDAA